jgi:hypothetical protein
VQIKLNFPGGRDLSAFDHWRFLYHGVPDPTNTIEIGMVAATNGVDGSPNYFGNSWSESTHVDWWNYATWDFKDFQQRVKGIHPFPDLTKVQAIYISVKNPINRSTNDIGSLIIDELQVVNIASRTPQTSFDPIPTMPADVPQRAAAWIGNQQNAQTGLVKSWFEETYDYAWLYDQALALIVLTNTDLAKARLLASRLNKLQNSDGSWYVGYHANNSAPIAAQKDIGPAAWVVYALNYYAFRETDETSSKNASEDARQGAIWLMRQQRSDGSIGGSSGEPGTEWNLDTWWALQSSGFQVQADQLRDYLLNQVWDDQMGRFKSSTNNDQIFLDNQTWGAAFLHAIGRHTDARRALTYARANLVNVSSDGLICGFDGAGPFSVWNEGSFQYIDQGGKDSQYFWDQIIGQQAVGGALDGSMPNSPDDLKAYIVWLSSWHGVAPTAWLYFAANPELPFTSVPPAPAPPITYFEITNPTLTWNPVPWAVEYQLVVATTPTFAPASMVDTRTIPFEAYSTTLALPSKYSTYYWHIRAKNAQGKWGAWSKTQSFVVYIIT